MSANVDRVEHAITESLNGMQLGEKCVVQTELNELRQLDPGHWRENVQLFAKMTSNYAGFPHLEIENAAKAPDAPITCPERGHRCPVSGQPLATGPAPHEAPPAPPQPEYVAPPPRPEYVSPPPLLGPMMPQAQFLPPPPGPDLGTSILSGLAVGIGEGLAVALSGRFLRQPGYNPYVRYNNFNNYDPDSYNASGYSTNEPYQIYPPPAPAWPRQHRTRW